jgi:TPP-dependent 2-oxoacid decarboxylase
MPSRIIGEYWIERLRKLGVRHVFGVPGDYVLGFRNMLQRSPLRIVNTCNEQAAGFAADAYARVQTPRRGVPTSDFRCVCPGKPKLSS